MDDETLKKSDLLMKKIDERIRGNNLKGEKVELTAKDLQNLMISSFSKYNNVLFDKVKKDIKQMNKSIAANRIFNKKIPFIYSITPTIYEDGKKEIVVVFANSKNCKGIAVVSENKEVTFEFMRDGFSINESIKFLKDNFDYFDSYFTALNSFAVEYPGFGYEWNSDAQNLYSKELLNDGFVAVRFDLNDPQNTRAFLSRIEDIEIARTRTRKYGEMYDFVEFYNDAFLRSFKVNEEELNPLYKKIVENSKVNSKGQERVLKK